MSGTDKPATTEVSSAGLRNVKDFLELLQQLQRWLRQLILVEFLNHIQAASRDERVEQIALFKMSAVSWLVAAHFDLDCYGRFSLLADLDLLVVALNGSPTKHYVLAQCHVLERG